MSTPSNPYSGYAFAGHTFRVDAYRDGQALSNLDFQTPVSVTIHYSDADVQGLNEDSLTLRYWDGSMWSSSGITVIERDMANNRFVATITHLSEFALFAQTQSVGSTIYLPAILRQPSAPPS